ncbi:hypothetical protein JCM3765_003871 [Sporobolomyces pararoseus]
MSSSKYTYGQDQAQAQSYKPFAYGEHEVARHSLGYEVILGLLCIFLPPLAVFLERGCDVQFAVNLLLTIFTLWTLGIVHAFYIFIKTESQYQQTGSKNPRGKAETTKAKQRVESMQEESV